MIRNLLSLIVFAIGLMAVLWIGLGYVGHNPMGASVALLVGLCYCIGGWELLGFQRNTRVLAEAITTAPTERSAVPEWLKRVPPRLRAPVALRLQGDRAALPGPALTPYLVGLLVLLGMLGTLLGMMATLRGTGIALESATDLQSIRGSLASPVEGLAVAFGTSIAGVATSAMLGLLSALLRRERAEVVQQLDLRVATDLHGLTRNHQRDETQQLLRQQAQAMPALVERLQQLAEALQQHSTSSQLSLVEQQAAHHARSEANLQALATSIEQTVQRGIQQGGVALGERLQPMLKDTLAAMAREAQASQSALTNAASAHLRDLQEGLATLRAQASAGMAAALAAQQAAQASLLEHLQQHLHDSNAAQHAAQQATQASTESALQTANAVLVQQLQSAAQAQQEQLQSLTVEHLAAQQAALQAQQQQLQAAATLLSDQGATLQQAAATADQARQQQWAGAFASITDDVRAQLAAQVDALAASQSAIAVTMEQTASAVSAQLQSQSTATFAEVARLLDAASEAPRAAAEVVGELRQRLSDSLAHDTAVLAERNQLLQTVQTLLQGINTAAIEQRSAVDGLIGRTSEMFASVDQRIGQQLDAGARQMELVAKRVGSAGDGVASMATALDTAVTRFDASSESLSAHLQQLATALDASLARSDEQLAYYVAQAREVVDLSLLSQKQITEELQQLARNPGV